MYAQQKGVLFLSMLKVVRVFLWFFFFFSSRRRHTRSDRDWSSDVCSSDLVGRFYVRNAAGHPVPLSTLVRMREVNGPEFTTRFNEYRAAQINGLLAPGRSEERRVGKECRSRWSPYH